MASVVSNGTRKPGRVEASGFRLSPIYRLPVPAPRNGYLSGPRPMLLFCLHSSTFLKHKTNCPYLLAPHGYYLRDETTHKPLIWDSKTQSAVPFDTPGTDPVLEGQFKLDGLEIGADNDRWNHQGITAQPVFQQLLAAWSEHVNVDIAAQAQQFKQRA